jgi:hypothetical protein
VQARLRRTTSAFTRVFDALWARDEKRKEEPMSGLFDDDEEGAAEKLRRAGAPGRTILAAALPRDRDGGVDRVLTPDQVIGKRFPPRHRQMPTYERGIDGEILYESPAQIIDERFPKEGEARVRIRDEDLRRLLDAIPRIEDRARAEKLQRDWERRLLFDPRPLGGEPKKFVPRRAPRP